MGVDAADGALLYVVAPAENESPNPANRSANPSAGDGFVFGLFHIEAIVESALEPMSASGIDVSVVAPSGTNGDTVIYPRDRKTVEPAAKSASDLPFVAEIDVADRRWKFNCVAMNGFWARRRTWEPTTVLLAGLLVTGFLVGYIHLLSGHTARVEKVVAERTRELHESEQRFRRLVDNAGDSFGLHTEQGKILDVNKHMCESLGYTREELLSMTLADIDADYVPKNLEQYAKLRPEEYPVSFEGVHRRKDGTTFPVEVRLTSLIVNGQRLMLGLARDITERKRAEEALDDERRLLRTMLDMHERDRKLVAYEIHDGLAQQLTGALFKFQSIEPLRERDPDAAREMLDEAIRLLRDAMTETRRLIGGLRPPILDESGVVDAIDYLLSERRQRGGPKIEFVHLSELGRLAPPLESAIFRIVQEGLTNACRYSQSEKVRVSLEQVNNRVHVEVRDWGIGFDPARVERGHFGIQGIRERAQLLGGNVVIDAAPGKGTRIIVDLPLLPAIENGTAKTAEQD
jgi:PAS domain S-box-containing protein